MVKILQNVKIKYLCKLPAVFSIYTEFCSAQAWVLVILCKLTVWLISILFSIAFHWLVTKFDIMKKVIKGVHPPTNQPNLHLSKIRISKVDNY